MKTLKMKSHLFFLASLAMSTWILELKDMTNPMDLYRLCFDHDSIRHQMVSSNLTMTLESTSCYPAWNISSNYSTFRHLNEQIYFVTWLNGQTNYSFHDQTGSISRWSYTIQYEETFEYLSESIYVNAAVANVEASRTNTTYLVRSDHVTCTEAVWSEALPSLPCVKSKGEMAFTDQPNSKCQVADFAMTHCPRGLYYLCSWELTRQRQSIMYKLNQVMTQLNSLVHDSSQIRPEELFLMPLARALGRNEMGQNHLASVPETSRVRRAVDAKLLERL